MTSVLLQRFFVSFCVFLLTQIGTFLPILELNSTNFDSRILEKFSQLNLNLITNSEKNSEIFLGFFSLGVFPYLKATLFLQLFINIFPRLKIKNSTFSWNFCYYIRFLTLIFSIFSTLKIILVLKDVVPNWNFFLTCEISLWLICGSMVILWLNEIINEYGLGNGISLFFYLQTISNIFNFLQHFFVKQKNIYTLVSSILFILSSLYGIVFIEQGVKKIPLTISKSLTTKLPFLNSNYNYIPVRFNQAGVLPILLTVFILNIVFNSKLIFLSHRFFYWFFYFLLIIYFSIFYSTILFDLTDLSNQLQKTANSVLGLKPGFQTLFFLKETIKRVTLVGSVILAIFAIILNIIEFKFNLVTKNTISITTYLLISISIFLDLIREVENIYFFSAYK